VTGRIQREKGRKDLGAAGRLEKNPASPGRGVKTSAIRPAELSFNKKKKREIFGKLRNEEGKEPTREGGGLKDETEMVNRE